MAKAIPYPCGHPACRAWMVSPQAAVQGVRFTEGEARAVADLLNAMAEVRKTGEVRPFVINARISPEELG